MDGNGRWGIKHKRSRNAGHKAGLGTVEMVIKESILAEIKYLTLYTFSTENWKRPQKEIDFLFKLLENFLLKKIKHIVENKIKIKFIGNLNKLPINLKSLLKSSEKKTSRFSKLQINIALNYGSKAEIVNSIKIINKKSLNVNIKNIEKNLFTSGIPNPDILIRTGNTQRLSNFLLWQIAYTEIFFIKKLWPDFNKKNFKKILNVFKTTKRNFGAI